MTNLIISRKCNQACSYCFAGNDSPGSAPVFITLAEFENRLDYLDRSGIQQARFLGGEPTLHPQFPELVRRAQARKKVVIVFTNGWMPETALSALEDLPAEQCSVVMNVSSMGRLSERPGSENQRWRALKRLGKKAQIGCNLYRLDQDLAPFIDVILENGCKPSIRMGIAQPILDGRNAFLPTRAYPLIGRQIMRFAEQAAGQGIGLELDCGFVRCMFSDEAIDRLTDLGADLGWRCSPIIDIDIDGKIFHCFPLSGMFTAVLEPAAQASELRESFVKQTELYRQAGIYKECSNCPYKQEKSCSGGCLASTIRRFSSTPFDVPIRF